MTLKLANFTIDNFYCHKNSILIDDVEFNKIMLSNMAAFGKKDFKYLIDYIYWYLIGHTKYFNETKYFLDKR